MSLNLHAIVRGAINAVNEDEPCYLIQALSSVIDDEYNPVTSYSQAIPVLAQVQSISGDDMQILNDNLKTEIDRKFYLHSETLTGLAPMGQNRVNDRAGDYIYRIKENTWWKIYNVAEDFNAVGWCQVLAALCVDVPDEVMALVPMPLGGDH